MPWSIPPPADPRHTSGSAQDRLRTHQQTPGATHSRPGSFWLTCEGPGAPAVPWSILPPADPRHTSHPGSPEHARKIPGGTQAWPRSAWLTCKGTRPHALVHPATHRPHTHLRPGPDPPHFLVPGPEHRVCPGPSSILQTPHTPQAWPRTASAHGQTPGATQAWPRSAWLTCQGAGSQAVH